MKWIQHHPFILNCDTLGNSCVVKLSRLVVCRKTSSHRVHLCDDTPILPPNSLCSLCHYWTKQVFFSIILYIIQFHCRRTNPHPKQGWNKGVAKPTQNLEEFGAAKYNSKRPTGSLFDIDFKAKLVQKSETNMIIWVLLRCQFSF